MSETLHGTCHCGAVAFDVELEDGGLSALKRCNCSLCRRKSAIMAFAPLDKITITRGADNLAVYQWNTNVAKHYFCKTCGIYTHHQRRSDPSQCGFNIACVDAIDPFAFTDVDVVNGAALSGGRDV